jgi:hypothetical protein
VVLRITFHISREWLLGVGIRVLSRAVPSRLVVALRHFAIMDIPTIATLRAENEALKAENDTEEEQRGTAS